MECRITKKWFRSLGSAEEDRVRNDSLEKEKENDFVAIRGCDFKFV